MENKCMLSYRHTMGREKKTKGNVMRGKGEKNVTEIRIIKEIDNDKIENMDVLLKTVEM
jgi:hypothetical protein